MRAVASTMLWIHRFGISLFVDWDNQILLLKHLLRLCPFPHRLIGGPGGIGRAFSGSDQSALVSIAEMIAPDLLASGRQLFVEEGIEEMDILLNVDMGLSCHF